MKPEGQENAQFYRNGGDKGGGHSEGNQSL